MKEQLVIIRTVKEMMELVEYLADKSFIAFDTETTGLDKDSHIIGMSVCAEVEVGYYVILGEWNPEKKHLDFLETHAEAGNFIKHLVGKDLLMHNAPFDCYMVNNNYGIDLMPSVHTDTLVLGHLLNENRLNGLKERGVELFGESAKQEQNEMKESVHKNGGLLTKKKYELFKADADLIAKYGAKDTILTLKVFYHDVQILFAEGLDKFFYEDESMPLLRGPTYDMNTAGLRVDPNKLQTLKATLEAECAEAHAYIKNEIAPLVADKYPGTGKTNHFNIGSTQQLSWLLFDKLGNEFNLLTKAGKEMCKALGIRLPYAPKDKRVFIQTCMERLGQEWADAGFNYKTKKATKSKKVGAPWKYMACGKESLTKLSKKYKWVAKLLEYKKNLKLLNTYVEGIQDKMKYTIIRPSFLQHGTTSGRYSSRHPNFQNLPRDDKRVKACIISRNNKVFVGADYSQLEPRVFASFSGDARLLKCFKDGEDFYSVIGTEVFGHQECSLKKDDENSFAKLYPELRQISKAVALSAAYGTTAPKMAPTIGKSVQEAQYIIDNYFDLFPSVKNLMLAAHETAKNTGVVVNLFGRPRRIPQALEIAEIYGNASHADLPYEHRNTLNLAMNHPIQSTGASIVNRAAIKAWKTFRELEQENPLWSQVRVVMQVHDELILEGPESLQDDMVIVLQHAMQTAVVLPGVDLIAEPKIAKDLAGLK